MYYCENCKEKRIASKRQTIEVWGNNVLIWLKRFSQNSNRLTKNNQEIIIPIFENYWQGSKIYNIDYNKLLYSLFL